MRKLKRTQRKHAQAGRRLRRHVLTAGTATAISLSLATHAVLADPPVGALADKHQVALDADADADLLADREEVALGHQPFQGDQNNNGAADGAELAMRCAQVIAELPLKAEVTSPHQICKEEWLLFGLETCDVCGETVNMGSVRIINPRLGLNLDIPIIASHYMEHGSFSHAGDIHRGRLDIARLARTLELRFPYEPNDHQLSLDYTAASAERIAPDANDLDADLLADSEELAAGLNLYDADQDENLLPDGIQLAQRCAEVIDHLPILEPDSPDAKGVYKINYMLRGLEWCEICGQPVNMGYWQIVNPNSGTSMDVPEIARHFMQHGSFSYLSDIHGADRTNVAGLLKILELPSECGDLGTLYQPADLNRDCKVDIEDLAVFAERWQNSIEASDE